MRIGVFDRFWDTFGGAEMVAGTIADELCGDHDVTLVGTGAVPIGGLRSRLGLELDGIRCVAVDDHPEAVEDASAGYDLWVNCSYLSGEASRSTHGVYVLSFPTPAIAHFNRPQRFLHATAGRVLRRWWPAPRLGTGFGPIEGSRRQRSRCIDGEASLTVAVPDGRTEPVTVSFAPGAVATVTLDGGAGAVATVLGRRPVDATVACRGAGGGRGHVVLRSDDAGGELRVTGVVAGEGTLARAAAKVGAFAPFLLVDDSPQFVDSYDLVLANSEYTRTWTTRLWKRDSVVLYPPVRPVEPAVKEAVILSVGRFFDAKAGHSKKQLEMVRTFGRLVRAGQLPGWRLHLVGGCSPDQRHYLAGVREAAAGLPVELHVDAPRSEVEALYGAASIYWHATGVGEDPGRHPQRFEHFGITTVEAMSAAAVPIVYDAAGPAEVVEDGTSGLHFEDLDGLATHTVALATDPARLEQLRSGARERATRFAPEAFRRHLRRLLEPFGV